MMRSLLKFLKPTLFFSSYITVLSVASAVPSLARADATIGLSEQLSDTVIIGGTGNLGMTVGNTAPGGSADLDYSVGVSAGGTITLGTPSPTGGVLAPGATQVHVVTALTTGATPIGPNAVTFTVTDLLATNDGENDDAILLVLDHSDGLFVGGNTTLELDFGNVLLGSSPSLGSGIHNKAGEFRAGLELDTIDELDPDGKFSTDASPFFNLAAGSESFFDVFVDTSMPGSFIAQYSFGLSDFDGIHGSIAGQTLTLNVLANVVIPEPSSLVLLVMGLACLCVGHHAEERSHPRTSEPRRTLRRRDSFCIAGAVGPALVFSRSTCIRRTLMRFSIAFGLGVAIVTCICNSAFGGNPTLDGVLGDGVADLIVNTETGTAKIDTNELPITGFVLKSLGDDGVSTAGGGDGHFNFPLPTTFDQDDPGLPASGFMVSNSDKASSQFFVVFFFPATSGGPLEAEITGVINLGQLYLTFPPNLNEDLDFEYTVNGMKGVFNGTLITFVPEPSTFTLAALGFLCFVGCRQRRWFSGLTQKATLMITKKILQPVKNFVILAAIAGLLITGPVALAANPTPAGMAGDGIADLIVDGLNAAISTDGVAFSGFVLESVGGHFTEVKGDAAAL